MIKPKKSNYISILIFRIFNKVLSYFVYFYNYLYINILYNRFEYCGNNVVFDYDVWINEVQNISIGSNAFIGKSVILNAYDKINIGENCGIAAGCKLITGNHKYKDPSLSFREQGFEYKPINLHRNVWLGYNVIILPGVDLGENCVVAAGSVVTKSFPDNSLIGGNPAKIINKIK
jgi:maltose O-acetyltransferase